MTLLVKAEAARCGQLRGMRHTMLDDSDISADAPRPRLRRRCAGRRDRTYCAFRLRRRRASGVPTAAGLVR